MRFIKELKKFARQNKRKYIHGEEYLRKLLFEYRLHYQRQKVIGRFIVDFYFPKRRLIVEVDGLYHSHNKE